jgi:RHS repeat-associated protein
LKNGNGATIESLSYDYNGAGNRTKDASSTIRKDATPNSLNQITGVKEFASSNNTLLGEKKLSYDKNGNLTEVAPLSGGGALTKYSWDALNRLTTIRYAPTRTTSITYDGLNRWTKITETDSGYSTTKEFVWCELSLCEERSSRGVKRFFPQGFIDYDGKAYIYGRDHLGSIREVFDTGGNVVARYQYDIYGKRTTLFQNGAGADFGFTGHYLHELSGLHFAPYRAYNAELGRWISRDPIGEAGGLNLYGYVDGNPVNSIDLLGLLTREQEQQIINNAIAEGVILGSFVGGFFGGGSAAIASGGTLAPAGIIAGAASGGVIGAGTGYILGNGAIAVSNTFTAIVNSGRDGSSNKPNKNTTNDFDRAVRELGVDKNKASEALHDAKRCSGRGGKDNVLFDLANGDIISPETGEIIGSLFY